MQTTQQLVMLIIGIMLGVGYSMMALYLIVILPDFIKDTKTTIKIIKDKLAKRHSLAQ
jgi:hypothetical protein